MNAETAMPVRSEQHVSRQHNGGTFTRVRGRGWLPHLLAALMLALTAGNAEYPSAAGIVGGVGAGILESVFGTSPVTFTASDLMDPRLTRQFASIAQMAQEQREVRVWGGIHFRNSLVVGDEMGRKIASFLVANTMKPAK